MYGTRNQVVLPLNLETKIKGDDSHLSAIIIQLQ